MRVRKLAVFVMDEEKICSVVSVVKVRVHGLSSEMAFLCPETSSGKEG